MTGSVCRTCWRLSLGAGVLGWLLICSAETSAQCKKGGKRNGSNSLTAMNGLQGGGINGNQQQLTAMIAQEQQMLRQIQQLIQTQQQLLGQGGNGRNGIGLNGNGLNGIGGLNGLNGIGGLGTNGLNGLNGNTGRGAIGGRLVGNQGNTLTGTTTGHTGKHHHKK